MKRSACAVALLLVSTGLLLRRTVSSEVSRRRVHRVSGSWNRAPEPQAGYNVAFQPLKGSTANGRYEVFAGRKPLARPEDATFRPSGLAQAPDGSMYISDMVKGRIWRVVYRGGGQTQ